MVGVLFEMGVAWRVNVLDASVQGAAAVEISGGVFCHERLSFGVPGSAAAAMTLRRSSSCLALESIGWIDPRRSKPAQAREGMDAEEQDIGEESFTSSRSVGCPRIEPAKIPSERGVWTVSMRI